MSSGSTHKMYNYEVLPPTGVWDNIAAELDEVAQSKNLSSRLYDVQAEPPAAVWSSIAAELDEAELFQHINSKLTHIQIAPPAGVWEGIASNLDEATLLGQIAKRLQNTEVAPPAFAWNKISSELDAVEENAMPDRRRLSSFFRYAAAASIVGLLAFGAVQLFKSKDSDVNNGIVKGSTPAASEKINAVVPPVQEEPTTIATSKAIATTQEDIRNDAALEASKKTYAKLDKPVSAKMDMAAAFYFNEAISTGTPRGLDEMFTVTDEQSATSNTNSRYIMLMTPDGNIIRMSKKLGDLICCVSGEEQDDDCMHQLNEWKQKLANSYAGHSPGNFMDILSLVSSLQDSND